MKLAVLIPDRGDRPEFMKNCLRMLKAQTLQPDIIEVMNDPPENDFCDITRRYRIGYDRLRNKGITLIAMMENDDWYDPAYLEFMVKQWKLNGWPNIFGTRYTIYYHIGLFRWMKMNHHTRSSAMATFIRADLSLTWCNDTEPYTDAYLWSTIKGGVTIDPGKKLICIGIKHGIGMCGGKSHTTSLERYISNDDDHRLLKANMDEESYLFYTNYFKNKN